jgi:hypothetical protein
MISVQRRKVSPCALFRRSSMNCEKSVSGKKSEKLFGLERMKMSSAFCVTDVTDWKKNESIDKERLAE